MQVKTFSFSENMVRKTAEVLLSQDYPPHLMLAVTPSIRFQHYLASELLTVSKKRSILAPQMITIKDITAELSARLGLQIANEYERSTLVLTACKRTKYIDSLFPLESFRTYSQALQISRRLLKLFDELNNEDVTIDQLHTRLDLLNPYHDFTRHLNILSSLFREYEQLQFEKGIWDTGFLLKQIDEKLISNFFSEFKAVFLVCPVSLTQFEQRVFRAIANKLTVLTQKTKDYDFSNITSYTPGRFSITDQSKPYLICTNEPSRIKQLMFILSIIDEELQKGTPLHQIAVLNIDHLSSEMLFDACRSLGIQTNFSEGISMRKQPLFRFLVKIQRLFASDHEYTAKALLELIKDEFFLELLHEHFFTASWQKIEARILNNRIVSFNDLDSPILKDPPILGETLKYCRTLYRSPDSKILFSRLSELLDHFSPRNSYLFNLSREKILSTALELQDFTFELDDLPFSQLIYRLGETRIPMIGSYERGIQIVGLLEVRALSFEVVIVPSFNEGIFPPPQEEEFFLNSRTRKLCGLPSLVQRENLMFYYLKRVLDASKRAYIISLEDQSGEIDIPSRYKLLFEEMYQVKTVFTHTYIPPVTAFPAEHTSRKPPSLPVLTKNTNTFSRLDIDLLKQCETRYYIEKTLGIQEPVEISEEIELWLVGQKIHSLFRELYRDLEIEEQPDWDRVSNTLFKKLNTLVSEFFGEKAFYTHEAKLLGKIVDEVCSGVLKEDIVRFKEGFRICTSLMEKEFIITMGNKSNPFTIKGRIDRIDLTPEGDYCIIDYKTGSYPSPNSHFERENFKEVQLGIYGLLFSKTFPDRSLHSLGYFDVRHHRIVPIVSPGNVVSDYLASFESHLMEFLMELSPPKTLSLAGDAKVCRYCPYATICRVFER